MFSAACIPKSGSPLHSDTSCQARAITSTETQPLRSSSVSGVAPIAVSRRSRSIPAARALSTSARSKSTALIPRVVIALSARLSAMSPAPRTVGQRAASTALRSSSSVWPSPPTQRTTPFESTTKVVGIELTRKRPDRTLASSCTTANFRP